MSWVERFLKGSLRVIFYFAIVSSVAHWASADVHLQAQANFFANREQAVEWFKAQRQSMFVGDERRLFSEVYQAVTEEMGNLLRENKFHNVAWVNRIMLKYISLYRDAYECHASKRCFVSPTWARVFDANIKKKNSPVINLLMGISAHVYRDLPIAVAQTRPVFSDPSYYEDFKMIALIFARRLNQELTIINKYEECHVSPFELNMIERAVLLSMDSARDRAWKYGRLLAENESRAYEAELLQQSENFTLRRDKLINWLAPIPETLVCM